jgi:ABC-2 type transport system ATP-binding protein
MTDAYLSASNLSKSFSGKQVLRGISGSVRPGDVVGLLGANGAGKTTLIELLLGFSPPTGGSAALFGADAIAADTAAKQRVGFVPQLDELIPVLTGRQYLDLIASFYPRWDAALVEKLAREWSLELGKSIDSYSVGQRQKLSIVSALAHSPDLLLLDEPVASLDPLARRQFLQQLVETCADQRRAVLFSSHIVSDVERLANIIWILRDGQLIWQGDLDTLKESVVRVQVPAASSDAVRGRLQRVLASRAGKGYVTLIALRAEGEDWSSLDQQSGPDARIQRLSLEDIFVELHS